MTTSHRASDDAVTAPSRGRLFRKYVVLLVGLIAGVLIISGGLSTYFSYQQEKHALAQIQHEKALAAAAVIEQFIEETRAQIGWTTQLSLLTDTSGTEQRRLDYSRLLRQVPAITEVAFVDGDGREQLSVSRLTMDVVGSQADRSTEEGFRIARDMGIYYSPVYFRKESEPYLTLAIRGGGQQGDVTIVDINLKFIRDVISEIRIGAAGHAYVVDAQGRLVAHPDLALVLRQTDLSMLPQVQAARNPRNSTEAPNDQAAIATDIDGRQVLTAHAGIAPLNWHVFVETPLREAFASLYTTLLWNAGLLLLGLVIATLASLFLARSLVGPIQALQKGAARIGSGDLQSRIDIHTGDELQALADHFNRMAEQLQESYAGLERKVEERTRQLARSVKELETLGEVSQAVNSILELDAVLRAIAAHAVTLAEADAGAFCDYDEKTQVFRIQASHNMDEGLIEALTQQPIRLGEGAIGAAGLRRVAVQIANIDQQPGYSLHTIVRKPGYRSLLAVPLLRKNRLIGGLVICRKTPGAFAAETVDLVQTLANQSVLAIQNARLFREIEEKGRELVAASRHKSEFLANMSHELRTPLNAVLGYAELIQDGIYGEVSAQIGEILERIQKNGHHLLGLINAVLDLAKIEAGHLTLNITDYSMRSVVQTAVAAVESLTAEKNLTLSADTATEPPVGTGDEGRLVQVVLNLLGNAIKFTDQGEVKVSLTVADEHFRVTVSDTGPGIAPTDRARIFDEFQQVDSSSTREKGGTGLGLAISRKIIELHGGEIDVESEPGRGSTFWFRIPIHVTRQQEAA